MPSWQCRTNQHAVGGTSTALPSKGSDHTDRTGVLIVGAGVAGLLAANLLGALGISCLLVERISGVDTAAMPLLLGDAGLRACQAAGLDEAVRDAASLGHGLRFTAATGETLRHERAARGPGGHPRRSIIRRQDLLRVLRDGLGRFPNVEAAYHTRLLDFADEGGQVRATLLAPDGDYRKITASLMLGCDGRDSGVRERLGGELRALDPFTAEQRWLVAELPEDKDNARFLRLVCDRVRPTAIVPLPGGGQQYAFMLPRGERIAPNALDDALARMLQPWAKPDAVLGPRHVETIHGRVVDKLLRGRVILLGDAAHTLPWVGCQSADAALMDAWTLSWKLAMVVNEEAGIQLLDSHAAERQVQLGAEAARAQRIAARMSEGARQGGWLRDRLLTVTGLLPVKPEPEPRCHVGLFVDDGATNERSLVGRPLPQPVVRLDERRTVPLDTALGSGFALLRFNREPAVNCLTHPLWQRLMPQLVTVLSDDRTPQPSAFAETVVSDSTGTFADAARYHGGQFLLIRPDRGVAGAFDAAEAGGFADKVQRLLA